MPETPSKESGSESIRAKGCRKLRNWLAKVAARDALGAASAEPARAALARCEEALEGFAAQVYAADPESP